MKVLHRIKQILQQADMFAFPVSLRFKNDLEQKSLFGAFLSLIVIALCIYLFYSQVLAVFQKTDNTITTYYDQEDPPSLLWVPTNLWNIGIQINGVNMSDQLKYFDVNFYGVMELNQTVVGEIPYPLGPCDESFWRIEDFGSQYQINNFKNWNCLSSDTYLKLQGKASSPQFDYCELRVTKCTSNCLPQSAIDSLLSNNKNMITVNFYFFNLVINSQQVYTPYFDDSQNYKINPNSIALNVQIALGDLQVTTDESIMPWFDYQVVNGGFVDTAKIKKDTISIYNDTYLVVRIVKSTRAIFMNQVYVKITDLLAYIGGLMSLVIGLVQILIAYYNQVCFYIDLAEEVFELNPHHSKQPQIHSSSFNFLYYIIFLFNKLLDQVKLSLGWKKMDRYLKVVTQMQQNTDIKLLLQKLMYLERVVDVLLTPQQQTLLHKHNKETIQYSKIRRQLFTKEENHEQTELKIFDNNTKTDGQVKDAISKKIIRNILGQHSTQAHLQQFEERKQHKLQKIQNEKFQNLKEVLEFSDYYEQPNIRNSYDPLNNKL